MQHPMQPLVNDPICEEAVINILLSNENLYSETAEILSPKMFHTPKFAHIYNAISKIYSQGDSPNFIAVGQWLAQNELSRVPTTDDPITTPIENDRPF